jgi:CspA family cold shock protein
MTTGTVKWFNNAKGYGFILSDDGGEDLFAHYSSIEMEGYKTLKAGQMVCFDIIPGDKGLHATNITANENAELEPDTIVSELDEAVTNPDNLETA